MPQTKFSSSNCSSWIITFIKSFHALDFKHVFISTFPVQRYRAHRCLIEELGSSFLVKFNRFLALDLKPLNDAIYIEYSIWNPDYQVFVLIYSDR